MKNQLALVSTPRAVETAITPRPTKNEIIAALARLKVEENTKHNEAQSKEKERIRKELDKEAIKHSRAATHKRTVSYSSWNTDAVTVEIRFPATASISAKIKQLKELRFLNTDYNEVRKTIATSVNGFQSGEERIDAMLKDKATKTALQEMLAAINKK